MLKRKTFRKFLDAFSLILMIGLIPLTAAVLVSWNAMPGEVAYPLKLSVENMAVFVSQVRPKTEMELRLALVDRRYEEAKLLLKNEESPRGYQAFTEAASSAQKAVLGIKNLDLRERYAEELTGDLRRYQAELEIMIESLQEEAY